MQGGGARVSSTLCPGRAGPWPRAPTSRFSRGPECDQRATGSPLIPQGRPQQQRGCGSAQECGRDSISKEGALHGAGAPTLCLLNPLARDLHQQALGWRAALTLWWSDATLGPGRSLFRAGVSFQEGMKLARGGPGPGGPVHKPSYLVGASPLCQLLTGGPGPCLNEDSEHRCVRSETGADVPPGEARGCLAGRAA